MLTLALTGILGCRREPSQSPRQAILLLLDAARPDRFSCYGYDRATTPEMDRLADRGVVFHRHFAQGTRTRSSVSSLMYSRFYCLPLFPNSPDVPYSSPSNLFRRPDDAQISFVKALESAGVTTAAITAHTWTGEKTVFATEFTEIHDLTTRPRERHLPYPRAEGVINETIDWIRKHRNQDYFLYIHLMDPHYPHYFEGDAQTFFGASSYHGRNFRRGGQPTVPDSALSEDDRRYANALYDGSLRYMDRHIGRLTEFLRREELLDQTVIAITADHGEHLLDQPGDRLREGVTLFSHGGPWLDPVARIPLIIHAPQMLQPSGFDHFSEGVDVGPTLLGLLNVNLPTGKSLDGVDLVQVINGQTPHKEHVLMRRSIRTAGYKCLFKSPEGVLLGESPPTPQTLDGQLYDLVADPGETTDLFMSKPEVVGELLEQYRTSQAARFQRFNTAVSSKQPRSAFAISCRHFVTDVELPKITGARPPDGWSRLRRGKDVYLAAINTDDPLSISFPLPNGSYKLSLKMGGESVFEVANVQGKRLLGAEQMVEFGNIEVTDEVFRATIRPSRDKSFTLSYVGFVPPEASGQDPDATREHLERLRGLGYVGSPNTGAGDD